MKWNPKVKYKRLVDHRSTEPVYEVRDYDGNLLGTVHRRTKTVFGSDYPTWTCRYPDMHEDTTGYVTRGRAAVALVDYRERQS